MAARDLRHGRGRYVRTVSWRARCATFQSPPAGQQSTHCRLGKAVVDQVHHAAVELGSDHASGRLHYFLYARIQISVVVAGTERGMHAQAHLFVDWIDLWQPERGNECADQACAWQVDAFAEGAAQYRKADAATGLGEPGEKRRALGLVHPAGLQPDRDVGMPLGEQGGHLFQVIEAAEKRQIITRGRGVLVCDQGDDRAQRGGPMLVAGGDPVDDVDGQLAGVKWRCDIDPAVLAGMPSASL